MIFGCELEGAVNPFSAFMALVCELGLSCAVLYWLKTIYCCLSACCFCGCCVILRFCLHHRRISHLVVPRHHALLFPFNLLLMEAIRLFAIGSHGSNSSSPLILVISRWGHLSNSFCTRFRYGFRASSLSSMLLLRDHSAALWSLGSVNKSSRV